MCFKSILYSGSNRTYLLTLFKPGQTQNGLTQHCARIIFLFRYAKGMLYLETCCSVLIQTTESYTQPVRLIVSVPYKPADAVLL